MTRRSKVISQVAPLDPLPKNSLLVTGKFAPTLHERGSIKEEFSEQFGSILGPDIQIEQLALGS